MRTSLFLLLLCACGDTDDGSRRYAGTPIHPVASAPDEDGGAAGVAARDAAPPPSAFAGAPAYVAQTGANTLDTGHKMNPSANPAGTDCVTCHSGFLMGGTIYKDAAGTIPAAQVEVRLRTAQGTTASAYTDAAGNFYLRKTSAPTLTLPALVGVRDGANTVPMVATITNGSCAASGCHLSGAQGAVHM
jgi:hypothetical protein